MRHLLLHASLAGMIVLAVACGRDESQPQLPPSTDTVVATTQPTPTPQITPDDTPLPRHVSFAPGEVIDTGGQAGVVFVDPATGTSEGWLLPGPPANFAITPAASDGHMLFYRCKQPRGSPPASGCESSNAWYLFDTQTGNRVRFDMFGDYPPPVVVGQAGDAVLGVTWGGALLVSAEHPDQWRRIDVPPEYQLFTPTAQWNRASTGIIVSAFHLGTPQCGYGSGSNPHYACGTTPLLWQTFLFDRASGTETQLGDKASSFAWSPDGSMFLVTRASEQAAGRSEIVVYSRAGQLLWSQQRPGIFPNPTWSPDGSSIAVQVLSRPEPVARAMRLDVLDAATGDTRYRIVGAIACEGRTWTADSKRLIIGAYGFDGFVLADPLNTTLRALSTNLNPSPIDSGIGYLPDLGASVGPAAVDIDSGEELPAYASFAFPMVSTTISGSPLFGTRFAFVATASGGGGRGGCAEAIDPVDPPTTHFEFPPFSD